MAIITDSIQLQTQGNIDIQDITPQIKQLIAKSSAAQGHVIIFAPGSTAAITTIEYEPGLKSDLRDFLQKLFPYDYPYKHHNTWGDDNGSSHIQAAFLGPSLTVPFVDGALTLGTWQQIVLVDLDTRPRKRQIIIQIYS